MTNDSREVYKTADDALITLENNGLELDFARKVVIIDPVKRPPGIKLWGAIDCVKKLAGWRWETVTPTTQRRI